VLVKKAVIINEDFFTNEKRVFCR